MTARYTRTKYPGCLGGNQVSKGKVVLISVVVTYLLVKYPEAVQDFFNNIFGGIAEVTKDGG